MRKLCNIAWHEIQYACRSRLLLSIGCVIAAITIGLPNILKDDGTPAGRQQILLSYTLGAVTWVLGAITVLWSSTAISREVLAGPIILIVTKPIRHGIYWLGKWFGIVCTTGFILIMSALVLTGHLDRNAAGPSVFSPRVLYTPDVDLCDSEVGAVLAHMQITGAIPNGTDVGALREQVRKQIQHQKNIVAPGQERNWLFTLEPQTATSSGLIEAKMDSLALSSKNPVNAQWSITSVDGATTYFTAIASNMYGGVLNLPVSGGTLATLPAHIRVRFANGDATTSSTAAFTSNSPLRLYFPRGTFLKNSFACIVFLSLALAVLAAAGLFCSSCFEPPTAIFCTTGLILMVIISSATSMLLNSNMPVHHHNEPVASSKATEWSAAISENMTSALSPLTSHQILQRFSEGLSLSWRTDVLPCIGASTLLILLFMAMSVLVNARREIAITARGART